MIVNIVSVFVKPEYIEKFKVITKENHDGSIQEAGIFRFDVLQDENDPGKFILYEAFESTAAQEFHRTTAHYFKWRDTVADWMDKPRSGARYQMLFPSDLQK